MQHADTLTVLHHDDTRTCYTDVRYTLHRDGVRVHTPQGEVVWTEVLTVQAFRQSRAETATAD